jgi:hypothetical protein
LIITFHTYKSLLWQCKLHLQLLSRPFDLVFLNEPISLFKHPFSFLKLLLHDLSFEIHQVLVLLRRHHHMGGLHHALGALGHRVVPLAAVLHGLGQLPCLAVQDVVDLVDLGDHGDCSLLGISL